MQYLLLIYSHEQRYLQLSPTERTKLTQDFVAYNQDIVKSGNYRAGAQLQSPSTATTVRSKAGKLVTSDGPFAETKEQLGGYYLVECENLDQALAIAKKMPVAAMEASVEVRPVVPTWPAVPPPAAT